MGFSRSGPVSHAVITGVTASQHHVATVETVHPDPSVDNTLARYNGVAGALQGYTSGAPSVSDIGVMLKPGNPAFLGVISGNDSNVTGNGATYTMGGGVDLTLLVNRGTHLTVGGVFTAPVTGIYWIKVQFFCTGLTVASNQIDARIIASNRTFETRPSEGLPDGVGNDQGYYISALVDMDANDTVTVTLTVLGESGDIVDVQAQAGPSTFMCGWLVG